MTISGDGGHDGIPIEFLLPWHPGEPWYKAPAWKQRGKPLLDTLEASLRDYLPAVLDSARKLRADGWRVRLTICGLGCKPPGRVMRGIGDWIEGEENPWAEYYRGLGLTVFPVDDLAAAPRGIIEIMAAEGEAMDRLWYTRSVNSMLHARDVNPMNAVYPVPPAGTVDGAMKAQMRLEAKYGAEELQEAADDLYEIGLLSGKMAALRWILGDNWDSLDT